MFQRASDGRWVGTLSLGYNAKGRRTRKTVYGDSKAEVLKKLRDLHIQHDAGTLPDRASLTVADWLRRWLVVIEPTVEPNTLIPYRRHVERHLIPRIGRAKLAKFKSTDVEALYANLLADGVSAALTRKIGTSLTVALNHAVRSGVIAANPATGVRKPKAEKPAIQVLTPDQARRLIAVCPTNRYGVLVQVLLDTGLRPGEAFALTWADVADGCRSVHVTKALEEIDGRFRIKKPKTQRAIRSVELAPETAAALAVHRAEAFENGATNDSPAFADTAGGYMRLSQVHRDGLRPLLRAAKLPTMPLYSMRHSCATALLAGGVHAKVVSERLGHSSITLTLDTYSHVLPTMQSAAAGVIGAAFYGTPATKSP